jgi:hypothetical protein
MSLGILSAPGTPVWLNNNASGSLPRRCLACVTALLLMFGVAAQGKARSSVASTSGID